MFLSIFDIFKIGVGPSSSHTMGPMLASARFLDALRERWARAPDAPAPLRIEAVLRGSLAFTGKGHATDRAVVLGLLGLRPDTLDPDEAVRREAALRANAWIDVAGLPRIRFDAETGIVFDYGPPLPGHANGMILRAFDAEGAPYFTETYYSIGGGFVLTAEELSGGDIKAVDASVLRPYPFGSAAEMLVMGAASRRSIAAMKRANETVGRGDAELDAGLDRIWAVMDACIDRGLATEGTLPGGLNVRRRARRIHQALLSERGSNSVQPHVANDWLSVYAMAINEENAGGGRVVTAPTNGAAGVVPAVIRYYRDHCIGANHAGVRDFLLTAAAIGGLIKTNASISGAEVGCQGEVGSAAAMAAAGFCAALGGTNEQVENAAEIALEHHLGLTCDPIRGLVQVPCIERNGLGAIKAVAAASLALRGDGSHIMPLDNCIEAMKQTGRDMSVRYKETSTGGLAVNLPEC
ncbi:L-serine dehydratase 1 [Methylobacterium tardum]|uniref:L-serine dehydratase n=2 Tax=Methylobacterium TaxID=407 RepID=A0AA37T9A1_9HYPH|nr:L-serine ammonia-lyase [Methylobacterium tardum]URD40083.1 L-serine ammonia-lyase [Methylobacterium tardum]GJE50584.1 L-serine dehydratase 1 [Methylobacterium tardum]GLS69216.1 L-serine ammonia-lyase [Methylobacterium tardum]